MTPDEYVEAVLNLVERIPPGRVMSYGAVADALAERSGRASARRIGTIMARYGAAVPWHRVVAADGRLPPGHEAEAGRRLVAEGVSLRAGKVFMPTYAWYPPPASAQLIPDPPPIPAHGKERPTPSRRGSPAAPASPTALTPPK